MEPHEHVADNWCRGCQTIRPLDKFTRRDKRGQLRGLQCDDCAATLVERKRQRRNAIYAERGRAPVSEAERARRADASVRSRTKRRAELGEDAWKLRTSGRTTLHYWVRRNQARAKLGDKCMCSLPNCWHPAGECPCNDPRALQIDHVNGDGQKDRKRRAPHQILREVITDTTGKFQLLCASCNWVKRIEAKEGPHSKYRP